MKNKDSIEKRFLQAIFNCEKWQLERLIRLIGVFEKKYKNNLIKGIIEHISMRSNDYSLRFKGNYYGSLFYITIDEFIRHYLENLIGSENDDLFNFLIDEIDNIGEEFLEPNYTLTINADEYLDELEITSDIWNKIMKDLNAFINS